MESIQRIFNKIILDGQSVLYAMILKREAEGKGQPVSEAQFEAWQDEYKKDTADLVREVVDDEDNSSKAEA